ncbi:hypothetical protein DAI22_10g009250 [Oryza sativa Japonica Group]|nr:hypothetical protein DAI22_10g009250 [Oryza sativa Japonica Group]
MKRKAGPPRLHHQCFFFFLVVVVVVLYVYRYSYTHNFRIKRRTAICISGG